MRCACIITTVNNARKLSACAPRDRRSSVRQRRHWCCALHVVRVVPVFVCDAVVHRTLVLMAIYRSRCFHVAIFHVDFAVLEV